MRSFTCCTAMSTPPDEPPARMASVCTKRRQPTTQSKSVTRRRSEEHTSELQSQSNVVCRLLLEKKILRFRLLYRRFDGRCVRLGGYRMTSLSEIPHSHGKDNLVGGDYAKIDHPLRADADQRLRG